MGAFFSVIFWLAVIAGALLLLVQLSGRHYRAVQEPDALHFVPTEDGWRLTLTRYRPTRPIRGAPPVVLCAGAGMKSLVFDVGDTSLARTLAEQGYDTWLLDLRGRGPRLERASWSFDDYVEFDIPAALRLVCDNTGSEAVQWVGFGAGALAMFPVLTGSDAGRVRSLVALAAPVFFRRQQGKFGARPLRWIRRLRLDIIAHLVAPLVGRLYPAPLSHLQNRDNVDGGVLRRALVSGLARFGRTELLQYAEWLEQDAFTAIVQRRDYRGSMGSITTPTLFIAGPRDELAPPDMVEATANLMEEARERPVVVASRMHGMSTNYGHLDLLLGRGVRRDIHTHIVKWLDLHAGVELPEGRPEPPEPREVFLEDPPRFDATPAYPQTPASTAQTPPPAEPSPALEGLDDLDDLDDEDQDEIQGDVPRLPGN
jgi:pimeloyl-ACP methyl ester carboxylesterase